MRTYRDWSTRQRRSGPSPGGFPGQSGQPVDLEDLFGGNSTGGFGDLFGDLVGRTRRPRGPMKGPELESEITIDFAAAVRGATLELRPQGQDGAPVTVRIPPGATEGSRVRIPAQGGASPGTGPRGDLVLTVHVTPHPYFRREGDDLHLNLPITVNEAFHGAKVKVPTVEGSVTMKVPKGTQSGTVLRLRGKGVTRKSRPPGDLYVHFLIHIPTGGEPELPELIDRLAEFQREDPRRGMDF